MTEGRARRLRGLAMAALRGSAELVERGWTQGHEARDGNGRPVLPCDSRAVSWCAQGAIERAAAELDRTEGLQEDPGEAERLRWWITESLLLLVQQECGADTVIVDWNDGPGRTQAEVADALRRAAQEFEAELPERLKFPLENETFPWNKMSNST